MDRVITLRFRAVNRDIFEAIKKGRKKIETRAATERYADIEPGDMMRFVCAKGEFFKKVSKVEHYRSVGALFKKYKPVFINPKTKTIKEGRDMYMSFPGYKEKIKKHGLLVIKLK